MASLEELQKNTAFTVAGREGSRAVTFLPEPPRARRRFPVISVDDHIVEPPHTFEGRFPAALADRAPRVVESDDGGQAWVYDGQVMPNVGFNAVVGRPVSEYSFEPARFDQMRRGAWDIDHRVADMDLAGIWASMCFPSFLPGFAGQRLQLTVDDPALALASVRAWNDWCIEEWAGTHPGRIIPMQLPYLLDVEIAAEEVRRNADRGFKAMTFSEAPDKLGLPSLHSGHWDPLMAACEETDTVVSLHIGSSGESPSTAADAPPDVVGVLFFGHAMFSATDWLYSQIPVRFPGLKLCMSEGGIGWVAGLLDRLDHVLKYQEMYGTWKSDLTPREVMQRNFWFCAIDDPAGFETRHHIGVDHILIESDYPHADSNWPDTQAHFQRQFRDIPDDEVARMAWQNAADLFRLDVPAPVIADPNALWPSER
ncbi:MAG: amidohydrolase family protein [Acidimicrobiales bacterium]